MSLIICVTTYNRAAMLGRQLESLRGLTSTDHTLVVCDDGSSDDSVQVAKKFGATVLAGANMGIAFNKNRGLYFSMAATGASHILLLDDDTFAEAPGWELEWIRAIDLHGHVNYAPPISEPYTIHGDYTAESPAVATMLSGQCLGFHRSVLAHLGFMDTRYGKYGGEHVDLTYRAIRLGYGGFLANWNAYFFAIRGGLRVEGCPSSGTAEDRERASGLLERLKGESIYRPAWHTDEQRETMLRDVGAAVGPGPRSYENSALYRLRDKLEARTVSPSHTPPASGLTRGADLAEAA